MSSMKLEIKVISGRNIGKKNVYAKIYIDSEQSTEKKTAVDRRGKKNPKWDHTVAYAINRLDVKDNCTKLVIKVCNKNKSGKEEFIGEIHVKFKELYKRAGGRGGNRKTVEYKLKNEFGKSKGNLKFSYKFLEEKNSSVTCGCITLTILKILSLGLAGSSSN